MLIDFKEKTAPERYQLMASSVIPRPIAWIATQGEVLNIAPFSYFRAPIIIGDTHNGFCRGKVVQEAFKS